jgi:hypothetical protein
MKTSIENGVAEEEYLFYGSGEDMEVVRWTVNSPLLQLSPENAKKLTTGAVVGTPGSAAEAAAGEAAAAAEEAATAVKQPN